MKKQLIICFLTSLVVLSGCSTSNTQIANSPGSWKNSWVSTPDPVKYATNATISLYLYGPPLGSNAIQVKQTGTVDQKKMYVIYVNGTFHKSGIKETADELSFSVLADGSNVWGLIAKDKSGNMLWQQNDFQVTQEHLDFQGQSTHWKGDFQIHDTKVWTKNFQNYGTWETEKFYLTYLGTKEDKHTEHSIYYTLNKGVGTLSGQENVTFDKPILVQSGGGNVGIPDKTMTLESTVTMNGQSETFQLKFKE